MANPTVPATTASISEIDALIQTKYDLSYADALNSKPDWHSNITESQDCNGRIVQFPFYLDDIEITVTDEGVAPDYQTMTGKIQNIEWKKFSGGVQIKQVDFDNSMNQSMLVKRTQGLATQMAYQPLDRLINALNVGDTDSYYTTWDGQQLFSNTHDIKGTTYDNLLAGTLTKANFILAKTRLFEIPWGPNGKYLPMTGAQFYLIVPPALMYDAKELMQNTLLPETGFNTENILKAEATVIVDEGLTDSNDWFLIATLPQMKPFVHIENRTTAGNNSLISEISPDSPSVRDHDMYRWSIKSFQEVFPMAFFLCIKVVNA